MLKIFKICLLSLLISVMEIYLIKQEFLKLLEPLQEYKKLFKKMLMFWRIKNGEQLKKDFLKYVKFKQEQ